MERKGILPNCEHNLMKLQGVKIRVAAKTRAGFTSPTECWVRGCVCPAEYCCDLEVILPSITEKRTEHVLLCSNHSDATDAGKVRWDWHRIGKRIVFVPFGYEQKDTKEK